MRNRLSIRHLWRRYRTLIAGWVLLVSVTLGWLTIHQYVAARADFFSASHQQKQQIEHLLQTHENVLQTIAQLIGPADLFQQQRIHATIAPLIAPFPQVRAVMLFPTLPTEHPTETTKAGNHPALTSPILLYHSARSDDLYTLANEDAQKIPALSGTIHATSGVDAHSSLPYLIDDKPHYFLLQRTTRLIEKQDQPFPWYSELHVGLLIDPTTLLPPKSRLTTALSLYNPNNEKQRPLVERKGTGSLSDLAGNITISLTDRVRLNNPSQPFLLRSEATIKVLTLSLFHWVALGILSMIYFLTVQYRSQQSAQYYEQQRSSERRLILQTQNRIRMLNAISHDLRTPLTRLQLRISTLLSGTPQQQSLADIGEIQQLVEHSLSYLRDEELQESPGIIDINQLIAEIQQEMREVNRPLSSHGKAHWRYLCQPLQLRRAIQNLLNNAFRYGEQVALLIEDNERQLTIRVVDDGPGVDPALLEKITTPYFRADSSRNRQSGGIGLGLAIVQEITESHAGTLTLNNLPEGGFSAEITLPR